MVRKVVLTLAVAALIVPVVFAQTVDEVVAKHIAASGGADKIKAAKTLKMTGKAEMQSMEAPFVMYMKQPNMLRNEITIQGLVLVQAWDGNSGWAIVPFTGKKDPEAVTADEAKELQDQADLWPLLDYKSKGNKVELLGKDKIEGSDAYKLKLTRASGDVETVYLDTDSMLEIKEEATRTVRGSEQQTETSLSDYRDVNGLMIPFAIESSVKGSPDKQKITLDKVDVNVPIEDSVFKMPPPAPKTDQKPADKPKGTAE
jgi:outer membrane lipoprotein-sorting protein